MPKILMDELVESVTRGVRIKADDLDCMLNKSGESGDVRYLAQSGIEQGRILYSQLPYIQLSDDTINEKYYIKPRDIIIAKGNMNTKTAIASENPGRIIVGSSLFIVRVKSQIIDPMYLCAFLQSTEGKKQLRLACKGSVRANNITPSAIRNMWVYVNFSEVQNISEKYRMSEKLFYSAIELYEDIQKCFDGDRDYRA